MFEILFNIEFRLKFSNCRNRSLAYHENWNKQGYSFDITLNFASNSNTANKGYRKLSIPIRRDA